MSNLSHPLPEDSESDDDQETEFVAFQRLRLGDVCTTAEIEANWKISRNTIRQWQKNGLKPLVDRPKSKLWLVDDVVLFLKQQSAAQ